MIQAPCSNCLQPCNQEVRTPSAGRSSSLKGVRIALVHPLNLVLPLKIVMANRLYGHIRSYSNTRQPLGVDGLRAYLRDAPRQGGVPVDNPLAFCELWPKWTWGPPAALQHVSRSLHWVCSLWVKCWITYLHDAPQQCGVLVNGSLALCQLWQSGHGRHEPPGIAL